MRHDVQADEAGAAGEEDGLAWSWVVPLVGGRDRGGRAGSALSRATRAAASRRGGPGPATCRWSTRAEGEVLVDDGARPVAHGSGEASVAEQAAQAVGQAGHVAHRPEHDVLAVDERDARGSCRLDPSRPRARRPPSTRAWRCRGPSPARGSRRRRRPAGAGCPAWVRRRGCGRRARRRAPRRGAGRRRSRPGPTTASTASGCRSSTARQRLDEADAVAQGDHVPDREDDGDVVAQPEQLAARARATPAHPGRVDADGDRDQVASRRRGSARSM